MNVNTMRSVDRYIGVPLCWAAGLWLKLRRRPMAKPPEEWKTVLVMKFFGLGSVLLSTPFLSMLRRRAPQAKIIYLTFGANKELLTLLPQPDLKLTIRSSSVRAFVSDTFRALHTLRRSALDVVFDLEFFSKFSTLLSTLSSAPLRVGFALPTRWREMNLSHPVALDHSHHATELFLSQLNTLGLRDGTPPKIVGLHASPIDRHSMEKKLGFRENGFTAVAVNMNAGATSLDRRWDSRRFMEVARQLIGTLPSVRLFFTGTSNESGYVEAALQRHPELLKSSMNCAGLLTLGEFIALLERSSVFLTCDSGPMHIAASVGTPVVALFGPESPRFYGPMGDSRVLYRAISCSPCLNIYNAKLFVCPYNARCMSEIGVDEVLAAVRSFLPSKQPVVV